MPRLARQALAETRSAPASAGGLDGVPADWELVEEET